MTAAVLGHQRPRVDIAPTAAVNYADEAVELAAAYGLRLDDWQSHVLHRSMGETGDGLWASTRVGLSVPRQSGKTAVLEARAIAGLLLYDEQLIVHSAHLVQTALEAFHRVRAYFENYDDLRSKVHRIRTANGEQGIELRSGQRLRFLARSRQAMRGWSPDTLLMDEAQELSPEAWAAILPATSARPNPQMWLTGTPPSGHDNGDTFTRFRRAALGGTDPRLTWLEWSADPESASLDDPAVWAQANPGLGIRIKADTIADERSSMDDDMFARERLGMWSSAGVRAVITPDDWHDVADVESVPVEAFALAVDISPERAVASVGFAGLRSDGAWHVEVDQHRNGTGWVVRHVTDRCKRNDIRAVVIDAMSPAASLVDELKREGIKVTTTGSRDMAAACGTFYDAVMDARVRHIDQPQLNLSTSNARRRALGDAWAWNRKTADADITPLVAVTLALWGAQSSTVKRPKRRKRTSSGRVATVL